MIQEDDKKEAAVVETIGFVYIFAIVILSMSLIYVAGYPMLQSSMDSSIFESTEQSFILLQSDIKMVAFDHIPVKNLQIQLQGAALLATENSNITIEYADETLHLVSGEIEYQRNDKFLTYENGGVWKRYPDGSVIVSSPRIYTSSMNGTNITTIGVVLIQGDSVVSGNGIVTLNLRYNESIINKTSSLVNVTLKINSTYASEWRSYLENIGFTTTNSTDSSLIASRNNTMLVVGRHLVDVDIT
ncbi:MAG: hypothetical protein O8C66_02980 [Candidatus Methanoperedens sp.]|nr:hypothetical protein [Candidatus Methanoperedens sp.]MCZ7369451.1 hypothetical protein [Candidatus Methanoperedens sp.]